jgi:hypothetical protein
MSFAKHPVDIDLKKRALAVVIIPSNLYQSIKRRAVREFGSEVVEIAWLSVAAMIWMVWSYAVGK